MLAQRHTARPAALCAPHPPKAYASTHTHKRGRPDPCTHPTPPFHTARRRNYRLYSLDCAAAPRMTRQDKRLEHNTPGQTRHHTRQDREEHTNWGQNRCILPGSTRWCDRSENAAAACRQWLPVCGCLCHQAHTRAHTGRATGRCPKEIQGTGKVRSASAGPQGRSVGAKTTHMRVRTRAHAAAAAGSVTLLSGAAAAVPGPVAAAVLSVLAACRGRWLSG